MRGEFRVLVFIAIILSFSSCVNAATIAGGKYFHSESFNSSIGAHFRVYGSDPFYIYNNHTELREMHYRRATIMSDVDETVSVVNGTCENSLKYRYCFKGSSINFDDERTFQNGQVLSVMQIIIESLPSATASVTFTRESSLRAYCGENINVPISVKNIGTATTNMTYSEALPDNTVIISSPTGSINENVITFKDKIYANSTKNYSYTMINLDCTSKKWMAFYSFSTPNGSTISKNISNLNITTLTAFNITESITRNVTNDLYTDITYSWNITNTHPTIDLKFIMDFNIPGIGLVVTGKSLGLSSKQDHYNVQGVIPVGGKQNVEIKFYPINYSSYPLKTNMSIYVNEHELRYNSTKILKVLKPEVIVYMDVNNTINKSMTVNIYARNDDLSSKYYYLYGIFKGIGEEEPLNYNILEPNSTVLIAKKVYNTTNKGVRDVNFVFDGVYRDKDSKEHKLYLEQNVTMNSNTPIKAENTTQIQTQNGTNTKTPTSGSKNTGTDNTSKTTDGKKDVVSRFVEWLSSFLGSLFG